MQGLHCFLQDRPALHINQSSPLSHYQESDLDDAKAVVAGIAAEESILEDMDAALKSTSETRTCRASRALCGTAQS